MNAAANSEEIYDARLVDWRNHQVVYQVFVDRFAASVDPTQRASLYPAPRRLRSWSDQPKAGEYVPTAKVYQHEIDFWGGDLQGVIGKLDYIKSLGVNVLYLNPIFRSFTNHKYDTVDYFQIDPQYGSVADFNQLCDEAHRRGMHVVLDGVFNHTGAKSIWFQAAQQDANSAYRNFYTFGSDIKNGYLGWLDNANLPELNYHNPAVRNIIYRASDSVVQHYLQQADGWRLDVAFDLGPEVLTELTNSAHRARADALVTGEIYNYPAQWFPALDGVMNIYLRNMILALARGKMNGPIASEMVDNLVRDAGIDHLLKSWLVLSNHDQPRLTSSLPEFRERLFALALQATLPGSPSIYYGEENGMIGEADDPGMRGPMDWQLAKNNNAERQMYQKLVAIRNSNKALQVGDFVRIPSSQLFAFTRHTASVHDTVVVVANPTDQPVTEMISPRDGWLQDVMPLQDLLSDDRVNVSAGYITVTVPARTVRIYQPVFEHGPNYDRYKRIP